MNEKGPIEPNRADYSPTLPRFPNDPQFLSASHVPNTPTMPTSYDNPPPASQPLVGKTVLVTRAVHQADALAERIRRRGGRVFFQPAIEIVGPADWAMVDGLINSLEDYSRLVFVSTNAVIQFLDRVVERGEMETLKQLGLEIAAIGDSTRAKIEDYSLAVTLVPDVANSHWLANVLIDNPTPSNTAIFRADRGSDVLGDRLAQAGVDFEELTVYRSQDVRQPDPEVFNALAAGEIDWTTVTSSAIGSSLVNLFGSALHHTKIATISPTTTAALERLGWVPAAEAKRYDLDGVVEAIEAAEAIKTVEASNVNQPVQSDGPDQPDGPNSPNGFDPQA